MSKLGGFFVKRFKEFEFAPFVAWRYSVVFEMLSLKSMKMAINKQQSGVQGGIR
jgi:hypothetical protein